MLRGTILIVTLWVLAILTVFALALGQRASLEIKLTEYQQDKLKALQLAKGAIARMIWEKRSDEDFETDTLGESWANNEALFKDCALDGEGPAGMFTVSYALDGTTLYGLEDEKSKININEVEEHILVNLLDADEVEDAQELATSIFIWSGRKPDLADEEEDYYQSQEPPYHCKKEKFCSLAELLLVRGITNPLLYGKDKDEDGKISPEEKGLAQYLSVFGDGKVNINTASEKALNILINDSNLAEKITAYRKGEDGQISTEDDHWFSLDQSKSFIPSNPAFFNQVGGTSPDLQRLKGFNLCVNSKIYTAHATAEVKKVKQSITATIDFSTPEQVKYLHWHRN